MSTSADEIESVETLNLFPELSITIGASDVSTTVTGEFTMSPSTTRSLFPGETHITYDSGPGPLNYTNTVLAIRDYIVLTL